MQNRSGHAHTVHAETQKKMHGNKSVRIIKVSRSNNSARVNFHPSLQFRNTNNISFERYKGIITIGNPFAIL